MFLEKDDKIIGTGAIIDNDIFGVFVRPHSQRKGYGRIIMQALEEIARTNNVREVTLSVSLTSKKFYQSLGYKMIQDHSIDVGEGQHLDYWEARKRLI